MTSTLSPNPRGPGAEAGAGTVFRSELNPVEFLHRAAYMYPDNVAVVHGQRRYSYSELAERSWRLANALRSAGLAKGERVATLLFNSPAMLEAHFGVPAAGGVLVAVNNRLSSAEVGYILQHSGARYLLLDTALAAVTEPLDLAGVTVIRCDDTGVPPDPYEEFLAGASPARPASWLEHEEETISINYTSGTTGRPKGVQYTYRGAYLNALSEVIVAGLGTDSAYLWTLPMFHCNGWCFPWAVTAVAARHVTIRAVDAELIWELIDGEGITHYNGAPTVQLMVVNHPRAHRLERPVTAMVAAAPPSPTLLARMSELNFRVVHVYGLTETYGPITVCPEQEAWRELPAEQRARSLARQGQAYPSADLVRVVDEQMNDVPQDGASDGRGGHAREQRHERLLRRRGRHRHGVRRGLVPFRGPGRLAPRRQHRATRPRQGHHHLRRREHLQHRGRAGDRRPPGRARMRGRRDPAPALGRTAEGVRHAQRGRRGHPRGDHRVLPGAPRALQVPGLDRVRPAAEDVDGKTQKFVLRRR